MSVVQIARSIQLDVGFFSTTYLDITSVVSIDAEIINQRQRMGSDQ